MILIHSVDDKRINLIDNKKMKQLGRGKTDYIHVNDKFASLWFRRILKHFGVNDPNS